MNAPNVMQSPYERLASINVNAHTEKKNNLTYLSWAWAVDQLLRADPNANWEYGEPVKFGETMMVFCAVTAFGKRMTAQLPVMDYKNKAISNPDAFQVNTAMQRCLAKAIALHGLGLYIYAGEDLPEGEDAASKRVIAPVKAAMQGVQVNDEDMEWLRATAMTLVHLVETENKISDAYDHMISQKLDQDQKLALWEILAPNSKTRGALKKEGQSRQAAAKTSPTLAEAA